MGNLKVHDLNHTNRAEDEAACSALARQALTLVGLGGLVPNIYAWKPAKSFEDPDEGNFGWSICEFKPDNCFTLRTCFTSKRGRAFERAGVSRKHRQTYASSTETYPSSDLYS